MLLSPNGYIYKRLLYPKLRKHSGKGGRKTVKARSWGGSCHQAETSGHGRAIAMDSFGCPHKNTETAKENGNDHSWPKQ